MSFEDIYFEWVNEQDHFKKVVLLSDRGIMDGKAYVPDMVWQTLLDEFGVHEVHWRDLRYDSIIHLVTAADGAADFYQLDNNEARSEDLKVAIKVDNDIREAWKGHIC